MARITLLAFALIVVLIPAVPAFAQSDCRDYSCADYREHDLDNYTRARGRTIAEGTSPAYTAAFAGACADSQSRSLLKQVGDVEDGRVYGGVGQATCWWSVGDADEYFDIEPRRIYFLSRTGAKLQGHLWIPEGKGPHPGVVVTTGSIQASDQMYWWASRELVRRGYAVLTYDVQGQGQSETFGHEPGSIFPTREGVPSQQAANFHDGTIDALRFFLSTPGSPYTPGTWSDAELAAAKAGGDADELEWFNPVWRSVDRTRLGIVGHSLGASAVSAVQQCSDQGTLWQTLPLCTGRSFPIRAVVGWDALSGSGVVPTVPAMSQQADGYFLFPTLSTSAPDPNSSMGGFELWDAAGLDVFMYVVRGGTHIEWSQVPYTAATTYGAPMNVFYTLAWLDRWVYGTKARRAAGYRALALGPKSGASDPWAANYMSTRRYSAFRVTPPDVKRAQPQRVTDVRAWAGRSPVGDWAGSNADRAGRIMP
jgi:dienelactone hydrolase